MRKPSYETKCVISLILALLLGFSMLSGAILHSAHVDHMNAYDK